MNQSSLDRLYRDHYSHTPVLITGGAGFIGSRLVKRLVAYGAQVTVLDNLSTGSLDNLADVWEHIKFLKGDICNFDQCLIATFKQKIIFHMAALTSVPESFEQPESYFEVNVHGTQRLLEAAHNNQVSSCIFSSSAAVYGDYSSACHEELIPHPISPYGYSKYLAELLCLQYRELYALKTISLRYFNVYDPDEQGNKQSVRELFLEALKTNMPITIHGTGMQVRDFISVDTVVEANLKAALSAHESLYSCYNVASGQPVTILDLFEQLRQRFPYYNHQPSFTPGRTGDIEHSTADCTRLNTLEQQLYSLSSKYRTTHASEHSL